MNTSDNCLPADEAEAIRLVTELGYEESRKRLDEIHDKAKQRMDELLDGCHPGFLPSGYTALNYMSDDDRSLNHLLTLGLSICDNPRVEARKRVIKRINERHQKHNRPPIMDRSHI